MHGVDTDMTPCDTGIRIIQETEGKEIMFYCKLFVEFTNSGNRGVLCGYGNSQETANDDATAQCFGSYSGEEYRTARVLEMVTGRIEFNPKVGHIIDGVPVSWMESKIIALACAKG